MKNHALRWGLVLSLLLALVTISAGAAAPKAPTAPECTHISASDHEGETTWVKFTAETTQLEANTNYYLTGNVTLTGPVKVYDGALLCLGGYTITSSHTGGHLFVFQDGCTGTICDCKKAGVITFNPGLQSPRAELYVGYGANVNVFDVHFKDCKTQYLIRTVSNTKANLDTYAPGKSATVANFVNVKVTNFMVADNANASPLYAADCCTINMHKCEVEKVTWNWNSTSTAYGSCIRGAVLAVNGAAINLVDTTIGDVNPDNDETEYTGLSNTGTGKIFGAVFAQGDNATINIFGTTSITGNTKAYQGGAAFFGPGGICNLVSGTISNNASTNLGGGVYVSGSGKFNMYADGTISNNEAGTSGGGVHVVSTGNFTMYGGNITLNTAKNGGGGGVNNAGTASLNGGSITSNTVTSANQSGGGVYSTGTLTMDGTEVTGNSQTGGGSCFGIDVAVFNTGTFTMNSGVIGTSGSNRLGIFAQSGTAEAIMKPEITINGGTVASIQGAKLGSADRAYNYCTVTINGGNIGTLGYNNNGGVDYILNGGSFSAKYEAGSFQPGTEATKYYTVTIDEGLDFKPYDGKYLLAPKSIGTNMLVHESLNVMFHFSKVDGAPVPASAVATIGNDRTVTITDVDNIDEDGNYFISVPVYATEMAKTITLTVKDAKNNVINVETDSVKAYGMDILARDDEEAVATHTLILDMLNYGAAAQKYFSDSKVAEEDLATYGVDSCECHAATSGTELLSEKSDNSESFATTRSYHSANLTLEDQVDFNLYFWAGQIGDNKSYSYSVGGTSDSGVFTECLDEEGLLYKVNIPNLSVADLATAEVTFTYTDVNGTQEITDSVINYLVRNDGFARKSQAEGSDDSGLYAALMGFADSASKYVHTAPAENETPIG